MKWQTASGGIHSDKNHAIMAAIGETLERYVGVICSFEVKKQNEIPNEKIIAHNEFALFSEEQYKNPDFPWKIPNPNDAFFCKANSIYDNSEVYVPQELIGIGSRVSTHTLPSTSTGLAAHSGKLEALLSATLEVLERDALTVYWLNSFGGREIPLNKSFTYEVKKRHGEVYCFDITQSWNPFPVVIVCGFLYKEGIKRYSLGSACRPNLDDAVQKACSEWIQGCIFAGFYKEHHPDLDFKHISDVDSFDAHAVYYTIKPFDWDKTPLIINKKTYKNPPEYNYFKDKTPAESLEFLLRHLKQANIRFYYKNITTRDVSNLGVCVIRVISPELSLLHGDENMMFLGGKTHDKGWRYKGLKSGTFPNPYPHPLG